MDTPQPDTVRKSTRFDAQDLVALAYALGLDLAYALGLDAATGSDSEAVVTSDGRMTLAALFDILISRLDNEHDDEVRVLLDGAERQACREAIKERFPTPMGRRVLDKLDDAA